VNSGEDYEGRRVSTTTPPLNGSNETVTCPGGTVNHEVVEFKLAPIVAW
jgi:hypothetical protein